MATSITNRLGRSVLYTLSKADADNIRAQRLAAGNGTLRGNDPHEGDTYPGLITRDWRMDVAQEAIVRDKTWAGDYATRENLSAKDREAHRDYQMRSLDATLESASCNLQIFLDGNDTFWALSVSRYAGKLDAQGRPDRARSWDWPGAYIAETLEPQPEETEAAPQVPEAEPYPTIAREPVPGPNMKVTYADKPYRSGLGAL